MVPAIKDKAGSTTKSAVSAAQITVTDKEKQTQDISTLNRDTGTSPNKLKEIFDKTKVEEKQELIHMMNIVGNQIIHEAADHYGWKEGSTEKTPSPWSHRRTDRNHERRKHIVRSRIGKRERICFGIHGKNKRKRLDGQAPRYRTSHQHRLGSRRRKPDRRQKHRSLYGTDGDEMEQTGKKTARRPEQTTQTRTIHRKEKP